MKEWSKVTENKAKTTQKSRKTTKKEAEVKPDPNQLDLIEGKTVAELEAEAKQQPTAVVVEQQDNRKTIKSESKDIEMSEIRKATKRLADESTKVAVMYDNRNLTALKQLVATNGLKIETMIEIAIDRFLNWQDKKTSAFPFQSLSEIELNKKRTTIVLSEATKKRLDEFCDTHKQQVSLIINLSIQALNDEVKAFK